METSTNIQKMLAGNQIIVPSYQRAYSWDTEFDSSKPIKQVNQFLLDLDEYRKSQAKSPYYFGHFLFENKGNDNFNVVDGQQRMTTIVIFLSALFKSLMLKRGISSVNELDNNEIDLYEDMIKRREKYLFQTVDYDRQVFKDCIIDQITEIDTKNVDTISKKRFLEAFKYFSQYFMEKCSEEDLKSFLNVVRNAACTTHSVSNESEAIQMFIFQNNRGKKPSNLEIIKAEFMFHIHLYAPENEKETLIEEIKTRFETIYKSISSIEYRIQEDDVLLYTLKIYFNSLWEKEAQERIAKELSKDSAIKFIKEFTYYLSRNFENLSIFFNVDEKQHKIHSLISLGRIGFAMPFILKAYQFNLSIDDKEILCASLENILLRHRVIGTRAELASRLNDVYEKFAKDSPSILPIVERIASMKDHSNGWYNYWCDEELGEALYNKMDHGIAKFLLWKYENELEKEGQNGYKLTRYNEIDKPELEHISPKTQNDEEISSGYADYDDDFLENYLDCLGNYLLISKSHNCSIGNKPFLEKRESYHNNRLAQQREVYEMTVGKRKWSKKLITQRHKKIYDTLMTIL